MPVDIEVTCTDQEKIRELQVKQVNGESNSEEGAITTVFFLS
jgi:hypothetical protein